MQLKLQYYFIQYQIFHLLPIFEGCLYPSVRTHSLYASLNCGFCNSWSRKRYILSVVRSGHQRNMELHLVPGPHRLLSVHAGALGAARVAGAPAARRAPLPPHGAPPASSARHAAQRAAHPEAAARRSLRWYRGRGPRLQRAGRHVVREGLARDDPLTRVRDRRYGVPVPH